MKFLYRIPPESSSDLTSALADLTGYNKTMTILYLCALELPTLSGVILTSELGLDEARTDFIQRGYAHALVRTDKRRETGRYPRGGGLVALAELDQRVRGYLTDGRIVILLEPRSRFNNLYNVNALFVDGAEDLYLEILGAGFDASDLNRGDFSPHEIIRIPCPRYAEHIKRTVVNHSQYGTSVALRLRKIARMVLGNREEELSEEHLEEAAVRYLESIGETLILEATSYVPLPEHYLRRLMYYLLPLPRVIRSRAWGEPPFVVSCSFFHPTSELAFWDIVFPRKKYYVPGIDRPLPPYPKVQRLCDARAAVKIDVDMVHEGLISEEEAVMRITPEQVDQFLHPVFDEQAKEMAHRSGDFLANGLAASPGAATGQAIFDADRAEERAKGGQDVILVRPETSSDDVHSLPAVRGVLTQHGGVTSHAAVVAHGLNKPCVAGCEALSIDLEARQFRVNGRVVREGDCISVDGTTGEVFAGKIPTVVLKYEEEPELIELLSWADKFRRLGVWTNADSPRDAKRARQLGAEGIGLCRTEHMFFEGERRPTVVHMVLLSGKANEVETRIQRLEADLKDASAAEAEEIRSRIAKLREDPAWQQYFAALDALLPFQRADFEGIFEAMDGLPVIIRLIDPPIHEFLPPRDELIREITELRCLGDNPDLLAKREEVLRTAESMNEINPMLGLRGCRAGIMYRGLTALQVRALFQATCRVAKKGIGVHPRVMIPFVSHVNELRNELVALEEVAKEVMEEEGIAVDYKFGTMIEVPRAALTADQLAELAQFFSFGTNDLTQMTYGISRDDAESKFLLAYMDRRILPENPFQVLDRDGVGKLMKTAVDLGRATRPGMSIGICGEHGGNPSSIEFCHMIGLDYVSCSPYRVPSTRLAAAQAAIKEKWAKDRQSPMRSLKS